jgi:hypothetical protein
VLKETRHRLFASLAIVLLVTLVLGYQYVRGRDRNDRVGAAYARGIAFLAKVQLEGGDFMTYRWPKSVGTVGKEAITTVFTAAQLVHSLTFGEDSPTRRVVREQAIAYLLAQREPPGVWRYHGKASDMYKSLMAERRFADVDDTAVAWAALLETGHALDPRADLEPLRANRDENGLFNTWMGDPAEWRKFDPRGPDMNVNVNALFLFALVRQPLPEVCGQAIEFTTSRAFLRGTTWYPSPLAYTYFLSRAYADGRADCLEPAIPVARSYVLDQQQPDGGWGDDLETALGALTLLNTRYKGPALDRGMSAILARQSGDGSWKMAVHYTDANQSVVYFGSRELTTGFCLEALGKYSRR